MNKELKDLLNNYEKTIYGQAFPIVPSTHQLHLLLDYIANLDQQVKKQKEVIDKINLKIADYLENNYSIYAENEIEIDLINEIDNLLKEALNET